MISRTKESMARDVRPSSVRRVLMIWLAGSLLSCGGCGESETSRGTLGQLLSGGSPLSEMQITIHRVEAGSFEAIGIGFTNSEGQFDLFTPDATAPLSLTPGTYRWTLESVGAEIVIPRKFTRASSSELITDWTGSGEIKLELPVLKPIR